MKEHKNIETEMTSQTEFGKKPTVDILWSILDNHLHLVYQRHELGEVMFPMIVLRRMDCMLADVNDKVRAAYDKFHMVLPEDKLDLVLRKEAGGKRFYNTSRFSMKSLLDDPANLATNFRIYLSAFNREVQDIFLKFELDKTCTKLIRNKLLFSLLQTMCEYDFRVETVSDHDMGYFFEEIIRLANENNAATAGEHFTPRDAIRLMSAILFTPDARELRRKDIIRTIYDPTCGTGGMVNVGKKYIQEVICEGNEDITPAIKTFGQELNEQAYAIAKSEALITEAEMDNIRQGDTLTDDKFAHKTFNYIMANPPYGINWTKEKLEVTAESLDPNGRFSAGLPRVSDGQLLFLQHMISHMDSNGAKVGVVTNGSPLFSGGADSGESNIRKMILERDMLDCIIALPKDLFYNCGIYTYIWILSNHKPAERKGKVQLINATSFCKPAKKSLGNKRNDITQKDITAVLKIYQDFEEGKHCRIFRNEDFGYLLLTIEQPLRDEKGNVVLKAKKPVPDSSKRDSTERVPLSADVEKHFQAEVLPHIDPESWVDYSKTKIGYEINFTQYFYEHEEGESAEVIAERVQDRQKELIEKLNAIFAD